MNTLPCTIAAWTTYIFGNALTCVAFFAATLACAVYFALSPSWDRFNSLFTMAGMWALAGLQWSGNQSAQEDKRALGEIVRATPGARNDAAPVIPAQDDPEPRRS